MSADSHAVPYPAQRTILAGWALALLLTILAVAPLAYPGFFEAHSGFLPAFNAAHPEHAPAWGRAPAPIRGEGALPYLLIRPIYALSGSGVAAVKWGYGLAFLLGAAGVYAWTRRWLGIRGAVLASAIYTYLPWHLATVYVRGAYAEAWLWAFWPFALWAVDRLASRKPAAVAVASAVGLAAVAAASWTQPGLAALFVPLLVTYGIVMMFRRRGMVVRIVLALSLVAILVGGLVARSLPPAIPFGEHFLYPFQLLSARWGQGVSMPGPVDGLPFQLGIAATGLSLVTVVLWLARRPTPGAPEEASDEAPLPAPGRALAFWLVTLVVVLLLTLSVAAPMWRITRLEALLSYPWQVLALGGLPLAFLAGATVRLDRRLAEGPAWAGLVALVLLASYPYLAPEFTQVDPGPAPIALFQPVAGAAPHITLLEARIEPPGEITPTLTLTLTWQAVAPVAGDYTVFVHVLDQDGTKIAQQDTRPCSGDCPTDAWRPGDLIVDRHEISLPADTAGRARRLALGLYLLESGERVRIYGEEDRTVYVDVR